MAPGTMPFNLCIGFSDYAYRFASTFPSEIQLRLYQNLAHGGIPAFVVVGTFDQPDRSGLEAAKTVFNWHAAHPDLYLGQHSGARVLVLGDRESRFNTGPTNRGLFKLLTELHIPFVVSDQMDWVDTNPARYDLVIAAGGTLPPKLEKYVQGGGKLLLMSAQCPDLAGLPSQYNCSLRPAEPIST